MAKIKLNLGCGIYVKRGWVNVDAFLDEEELKAKSGNFKNALFEKGAKFVKADIKDMPFPDDYADLAEAHEVLEHMGIREIIPALKEIYRVLKPGGKFVASCPSFNGLVADWVSMMAFSEFDLERYVNIAETIYGNQAHEGEFHRCPITPEFMDYCLGAAGFRKGGVGLYRKGIATPQIGEFNIPESIKKKHKKKKTVLRNDTIIVEVEK